MSTFSRSDKEESLIRPWVGRPPHPETILDEFPEMTVTDYLRYRVTGCLPDDLEDALQEGAERFIKEGERLLATARFQKREAESEPSAPEAALSVEEVREQLQTCYHAVESFLTSPPEDISVPISVNNQLRELKKSLPAAGQTLGDYSEFKQLATLVDANKHKVSLSSAQKVGCILLSLDLNYDSPFYRFRSEIVNGRLETLGIAMQSSVLTSYVMGALFDTPESIDASVSKVILGELVPKLMEHDSEAIKKAICHDNTLGNLGSLITHTLSTLDSQQIQELREPLQAVSALLMEQGITYLDEGQFLCHYNAVSMLQALRDVHARQGIPPKAPEQVSRLVDLIVKNKVEGYRPTYPRVSTIKNLVRILSKAVNTSSPIDQKVSLTLGDRFRYWLGKLQLSRG